MPTYISNERESCKNGWAVLDSEGKELSCQETKEQAIRQMVAISLSQGEEPGGTWETRKKKK